MGLHREMRRFTELGATEYFRHVKRRRRARLADFLNRVGPALHRCSCCGWAGARFLDYEGQGYMVPRIVCPGCGAQSRHRRLWPLLHMALSGLRPGCAVLHVAPEPAFDPVFARYPHLLYVPTDLTRRGWLGKLALRADLAALPFRDNTFSLVLCSHVIEHVKDDSAALAEIARVAAPAATALILTPTWRPWNSRATVEFSAPNPDFDDHWRLYGRGLMAKIEASGMRCAVLSLGSPLRRRRFVRVGATDDTLFFCVKRGQGRRAADCAPAPEGEGRQP